MVGKSGINPAIGRALPETYDEEDAMKILGRAIALYCEHADPAEQFQRLSHVIEDLGFERFTALVTGKG